MLTGGEEEQINLYNANWLQRYDSLVAVALVSSVSGSIDDYAYDLAMEWELAAADAVLVVDTGAKDAYLLPGDDYPMSDSQITSYLNTYLYDGVAKGEYGSGVLNLFRQINQFYVDNYGLGYLEGTGGGPGGGEAVLGVVILLVGAPDHRHHCGQPAVYRISPALLRRGQPALCVPAHPLLARAGLGLVPPALEPSASAPAAQRRTGAGERVLRLPWSQRERRRQLRRLPPGRRLLRRQPGRRLWRLQRGGGFRGGGFGGSRGGGGFRGGRGGGFGGRR